MTDLLRRTCRRLTPIAFALSFLLAPLAARAETLSLDQGSGAPPRSLIGSPTLGPALGRVSFAALLALDIPPSGLNVGPRITGEVMYGFTDLAPQLRLDIGGRMAFAYHGQDTQGLNIDASLWSLDFIPDVKIRYAIDDTFGIYGDFGLGLVLIHTSFGTFSDSSVALGLQFGGGVAYALTPKINLLGEIRFDVTTKSGSGLFIALPTIGLEFH